MGYTYSYFQMKRHFSDPDGIVIGSYQWGVNSLEKVCEVQANL